MTGGPPQQALITVAPTGAGADKSTGLITQLSTGGGAGARLPGVAGRD